MVSKKIGTKLEKLRRLRTPYNKGYHGIFTKLFLIKIKNEKKEKGKNGLNLV